MFYSFILFLSAAIFSIISNISFINITYIPDFYLIILYYHTIEKPKTIGPNIILITGLLIDIIKYYYLGTHALVYMICYYLCKEAKRKSLVYSRINNMLYFSFIIIIKTIIIMIIKSIEQRMIIINTENLLITIISYYSFIILKYQKLIHK